MTTAPPTTPGSVTGVPVLIVSELPSEASALAAVLHAGLHHIVLVSSPQAAAVELGVREFAVVVCSIANTGPAQLDALAAMRSHKLNSATPVVLLMPQGADQVAAMRRLSSGPVDCVSQPVDEFILRTKVKLFVDMYRGAQRLREVERQGSALLTDGLTGLPNRVLFMDRAEQSMRHAARSGGRVAVAVMDLDQIHDVKDTLGPATGEELLRQIALRLTGALRRSDTVARIGDTAFGTVLACDTRDGVETVTSRLDRVMTEPFTVGGHRITVGGGIGVALFPEHGRDPNVLLERAHSVMVIAKQNSMGHLLFDPIQHADSDDNADSAEMNAEELFKVTAA
jgi:diguanylate cyclase (GGDEF)-like protein